ncbi:MAG: hypothetical protein PUE94_03885 [Lachnospiraceae bacterium]|nr:hypothetical protein [Lachnospiraceae bacterium]
MAVIERDFPVLCDFIHEQLHLDDEVLVECFLLVGTENVHPQFIILVVTCQMQELLNQLFAFRNADEAKTMNYGAKQDDFSELHTEQLDVVSFPMRIIVRSDPELLNFSDDETERLAAQADALLFEKVSLNLFAGDAVALIRVFD